MEDRNDNIQYYSVSFINAYISKMFSVNPNLTNLYLTGEISNFKYSKGHCYFTLKDETSEISCVMYDYNNAYLKFQPVDGMSVNIKGDISVWVKKGTYSVNVKVMTQVGMGILYQEFLNLKEKLDKEGLFDAKYKKPLPIYPEKVAVITAETGEAIKDIISTFNKRFPLTKIYFFKANVQGVDAPLSLIAALKAVYTFNETTPLDALIIGRGGGSFEDLACFNDEALARTLFASPIPTVAGIGHEGDYTICDFVASFRAPTPTGAAMALTKDKVTCFNEISDYMNGFKKNFINYLSNVNQKFQNLKQSYVLMHFPDYLNQLNNNLLNYQKRLNNLSPINLINHKLDTVSQYVLRANNQIKHIDEVKTNLFKVQINKLEALSPVKVMDRGFTIVKNDEGKVIKKIKDINNDHNIKIYFQDGSVEAKPIIETINLKKIEEE